MRLSVPVRVPRAAQHFVTFKDQIAEIVKLVIALGLRPVERMFDHRADLSSSSSILRGGPLGGSFVLVLTGTADTDPADDSPRCGLDR